MSQAAVRAALDAPNIELIPGSGVSIFGVLQLVCDNWKPSASRGKTIKKVMCNYIAAPMNPENRRALCEALFSGGDTLEKLLIEAISQASAAMLQKIGNKMSMTSGDCALACSASGVSYELQPKNIAMSIGQIAQASYSGDGFDFGGLLSESISQVTAWAATQAMCCVTTLIGDLAAKAIKLTGKMDFGKRVAQLRAACNEVMLAAEDEPVDESGYSPGWGEDPDPSSPSSPSSPTPVPPPGPGAWIPQDTPAAPTAGEPTRNWMPLLVAFAGVGVATFFIVRR